MNIPPGFPKHIAEIHPYHWARWIGESYWFEYAKRTRFLNDPPWLERAINSEILHDSFVADLSPHDDDTLTLTVNSVQWEDYALTLRKAKPLRKREFAFPLDIVFSGNVRWMLAADDPTGLLVPGLPSNLTKLQWSYSTISKRRSGFRFAIAFHDMGAPYGNPVLESELHRLRSQSGFMPKRHIGKELTHVLYSFPANPPLTPPKLGRGNSARVCRCLGYTYSQGRNSGLPKSPIHPAT